MVNSSANDLGRDTKVSGYHGQRRHKTNTPIILVVIIILVSYSLFFVFQISTELNVKEMILQESRKQQEQTMLQLVNNLGAVREGSEIGTRIADVISTTPLIVFDDSIENIGVIDNTGTYLWNSDPTMIDSALLTPSAIALNGAPPSFGTDQEEQPLGLQRPLSIVHRIDGSEYLTSIVSIPIRDASTSDTNSKIVEQGNALYLVASTPLSVVLDEIDDILFGQRIQNFSLVAGVSLVTIIMTFFMSRNLRLKKEAKNRATELEQSYKLIQNQKMALQNANHELRKLDELKDNFISVASHELKNPIQPILLCSELAKKGEMDKEKALDIVLINARRLRQLASDILDVSKIDTGSFTCVFNKVRINEMVSELVKSATLIGNSKVKLEISIDQDIEIDGDKVRLFQVFSNLINNASKFTSDGYIRIETKTLPEKNRIEIAIRDTGTGIAENILPGIFGKFVSYSADQRNRHGSGLGLYIVKAIVNAHYGEIVARNNNPERGATFTVSLPIRHEKVTEVEINVLAQSQA